MVGPGRAASRILRTGLLALVIGPVAAGALVAQASDPPSVRSVLQEPARDAIWRIATTGGATFEGRLTGPVATTVRLGDAVIELTAVTAVWQRGRATRSGAVIGALVVGVGSAIGIGYDCATEGAEVECHVLGATVVGGLLGVVVGGATGAAVGAVVPRWHRRYP